MYNRLFTKILDSSIWLESSNTRIVWITLLAAMDETGYAHFSAVENLANRARVSVEDTGKALECLLAPDPNSANPDNEGRRIERVPGGFMILNADTHRKTLNREIRREQTRLRVAKHRALQSGNAEMVTPALQGVTSASESENASVQGKRVQRERDYVIPESLLSISGFTDEWIAFKEMRKSKRAKVTPRAAELILGKLAQRPNKALDALQTAISHNWTGFEWHWLENGKNGRDEPRISPQHRQNRINFLNDKKQKINRQIKDPKNPPSWATNELDSIDKEMQHL